LCRMKFCPKFEKKNLSKTFSAEMVFCKIDTWINFAELSVIQISVNTKGSGTYLNVDFFHCAVERMWTKQQTYIWCTSVHKNFKMFEK
jgi:hypothetical protein